MYFSLEGALYAHAKHMCFYSGVCAAYERQMSGSAAAIERQLWSRSTSHTLCAFCL